MNCEHRNLTFAKMLRARRGREGKEQKMQQIGRERGTLFPAALKLQGVGEESNRICRSCSWRHSSLVKSLTNAPPPPPLSLPWKANLSTTQWLPGKSSGREWDSLHSWAIEGNTKRCLAHIKEKYS